MRHRHERAGATHKHPMSIALKTLDSFTARHLNTWLDQHVRGDERDAALETILSFLARQSSDDLAYWPDHSWGDILATASEC